MLLLRKPGGDNLLVHAFFIPLSASVLLLVAIGGLLWGLEPEDREVVNVGGLPLDAQLMRDSCRGVAVGIITGVVAGAVIAATQRWHEYERDMAIEDVIAREAERSGYHLVQTDQGLLLVDEEDWRKLSSSDDGED